MTELEVEIPATCQVHHGSTRLVVRREPERIVLDADGIQCCVLVVEDSPAMLLLDALWERLG